YQTAQELAADLERFRGGQPITATPVLAADQRTLVVPRSKGETQVLPRSAAHDARDARRPWNITLIVGAIIVVMALIAFFLVRLLSPSQPLVRVPDVTGQLASAACDQIVQQHLKCDQATKQNDATVPKGFVISYSP